MSKDVLDAIDRKILKFLVKNARMPYLEIARECGISGAAIHQRIKKLEDTGVVLGSRMIVNPKMLEESNEHHDRLVENVAFFREKMIAAGFDIKPTVSAICAVMLYDAKLSQDFAAELQKKGIFVTGFYYPVVPKGQARIRVQVSAGHTREQLEKCVAAFTEVGKQLGVLK